jgi:hypothetical protein
LKGCDVFASSQDSYNCVKARANAIFIAEKCNFQSTVDAAVSGERTSTIAIRDTSFSFAGNLDANKKRIGIQGIGAKGLIQRCTFFGPCVGGIDWMDSPDQEVRIEGCQFDNCDVGIQTNGCKAVVIKSNGDSPCEIKNAIWGLSFKQSRVELSMVNVEGFSEKNRVAMQITEKSEVKCSDSEFLGFVSGMLVNQSSLAVNRVSTRNTSFVGLLVDGGSVEGNDLNLERVSVYGLVVLSKGATVKLSSLKVDAETAVGQKITPAVYVGSGSVEFTEGVFSNCLCGVFVDPKREIINTTGLPDRRSLIELIGNPDKIKLTLSPVEVTSDRMTLTNCDLAWLFNGPGTSRVKQLSGNLTDVQRTPRLLAADLKREGVDLTDFEVVAKPGQK